MDTMLSILPVAVLVAALAGFGLPAWCAALAAFAAGAAVAAFCFGLPCAAVAQCAASGAATGLFPIGLVIVAALFTYAATVESGAIAEIKGGLSRLSGDRRFQALLVAWGFGGFMEGMAGFGTAVAIPCAILVGIGFDPVKAVLCCLVANTTPTAFGSAGVPTMVLAGEAGADVSQLSAAIAFLQLAATSLSPFLILAIVDGWRGVRECWRLALVADAAFLSAWAAVAPLLGCELPDIAGGIAVMAAFALMGNRSGIDLRRQAWAWMPFAFVVLALGGAALMPRECRISPGFAILAAGASGALCQGLRPARVAAIAARTVLRYSPALFTICAVLALAKVMGAAGMTRNLAGALVSATGSAYPAVSAIVGALGGFVTGSGTSSNVLFGSLQASVASCEAQKILFAAANVMGAGIGKMICPQSIVLGCAAAGLAGRERSVMVKALGCFAAVLSVACLTVVVWNALLPCRP